MKVLVIGISGQVASGKDTLGEYIANQARQQGFVVLRRAYGDALKEEVAQFLVSHSYEEILDFLNEKVKDDEQFDTIMRETFDAPPCGFWQTLCTLFGAQYYWDYRPFNAALVESQMHDRMYKERYRELMKWWATEYRRETFGEDYWTLRLEHWVIEQTRRLSHQEKVLFYIPDVRFTSEVHSVQATLQGYVIRIVRPGHEPTTKHISEHQLTNYRGFNMTVINDKTLKDLYYVANAAFMNACSWKWGNAGDAA